MNATCRNDAGMVDAWVFKTRVYRFIWDCVCDNVRSMSKDWCKGLVCRCFSRGREGIRAFVKNGPDVCVRLAGIPKQSSDCKATE